jgi:hypothetical protein
LFAVDRRTGEFLWDSPRTPLDHTAEYSVGVSPDGGFIVAGKNCVRRYDIISGRLKWETIVDDSFGRAMLTEDAVYVPVKNTIIRLDVETGKQVSQATVSLTSDDPVGNLYSDGEKVWVVGANKLYALTNLQQRLVVLESRIKKGDANAHIERMKLLAKDSKLGPAVEDLLNAFKIVQKDDGSEPAASLLFDGLNAIQLDERQPDVVLGIMNDSFVKDDAPSALPKELASQRSDLIFSSLRNIRKQKMSGTTAAILDVLPLISEQYQLAMARQALVTTATDDDLTKLRLAVESGKPSLQRIAVDAFAHLAKGEAKPTLQKLLESDDESIQFAGARALATRAVARHWGLLSSCWVQKMQRFVRGVRRPCAI